MLKSPTILGVLLLVWIVILATLFLRKSTRRKQLIKLSVAVIATVAVIAGLAYSFHPGVQYGLVIRGQNITVTFFENNRITFNACNSNVELLNETSGISLLHLRKMGVYDSATGIASGYFLTRNGTTIYVIITNKKINYVLLIRDKNHVALVGLPNIENAYSTLIKIQEECNS